MNNDPKILKPGEDYWERTQRNQFFLGDKNGQDRLHSLTIGVAGLGGMGSNIAEQLARLGVGHLKVADPDTIDVSNINRQVIANFNTVGKTKVEASRAELKLIAPDLKLKSFNDGITEANVKEFVEGCDFIVDEIDVFPLEAHSLLHRECRKSNIPIYSAYVIGLSIHFYKFQGEEFTFEDFIEILENKDNPQKRLDAIIDSFMSVRPTYLTDKEVEKFKVMAFEKGVPIFGPACLLGHSIVVTRILCDFLNSEILGTKVTKTPVMPQFVSLDLSSLELKIENFQRKAAAPSEESDHRIEA